ncbi:MAG: TolC family protein [Flavobacteriales bacterium]
MRNVFVGVLYFCVQASCFAQQLREEFTPEMLLKMVKENHPVSKQAELLKSKANAVVLKEKGQFDPYLYSEFSQKKFDDKEYYRFVNTALKVPTWFGADFKVGFDQSSGVYVNPEDQLPSSGLAYAGISMPVLQGLWVNERRVVLQQARIYQHYTAVEQRNILNDLYYEALQVYWEWFSAHQKLLIYTEAEKVAGQRFQFLKQSYLAGEHPAIDTLESFLQLQSRSYSLISAKAEYAKAIYALNNFLWTQNDVPLELGENVVPVVIKSFPENEGLISEGLIQLMDSIVQRHPAVQSYAFKQQQLELEQKWKLEKMKPKLNLNYNLLTYSFNSPEAFNISPNNYKVGVDFSFPVFLRRERGDLRLTNLKIQETEWQLKQKVLEQKNKINQYHADLKYLSQQRQLFSSMVSNYEAMLNAERSKFDNGESFLFLINTRELSLIDSQLKLVDITAKLYKTKAGYLWAIGDLCNGI